MESALDTMTRTLHRSTTLLSKGAATVMGHTVPAILVRNYYGQEIVWGQFNVQDGKFKGKRLANNANTDDVIYCKESP